MSKPIIFGGTIPRYYEDILTPFLFDAYADDLLTGIGDGQIQQVLELAAGTGSLTKRLIKVLPGDAQLTVTDLQEGMLEIARQELSSAANIEWNVVDMTSIPYEDNRFDLIICQFGLMLVPDRAKALAEMHRVLKKGGQLLFNVWGDAEKNQVWDIAGKVIHSLAGVNPMLQDPGPFSFNDEQAALALLAATGFVQTKITAVDKTGVTDTAAMAAKGFLEGLPVVAAIGKKDPSLVPKMMEALELAFREQLGTEPLWSALQALVFDTYKP